MPYAERNLPQRSSHPLLPPHDLVEGAPCGLWSVQPTKIDRSARLNALSPGRVLLDLPGFSAQAARIRPFRAGTSYCLDPCDARIDPADHLAFQDEAILPRSDSQCGRQTIRKYKLDRSDLALRRSRRLNLFQKALLAVNARQIEQGRKHLTADERALLLRFGEPGAPFSLMFRGLLQAFLSLVRHLSARDMEPHAR